MLKGITLCLIALWLTNIISENKSLQSQEALLQKKVNIAKVAISMEGTIKSRLEKIEKSFDKSKTINSSMLQIEVEKIARESSLDYSLSNVETSATTKFQTNRITLNATSPLASLITFEEKIQEFNPYMYISQAIYTGDKRGIVRVKYIISSFELK